MFGGFPYAGKECYVFTRGALIAHPSVETFDGSGIPLFGKRSEGGDLRLRFDRTVAFSSGLVQMHNRIFQ